MNNCFKKRGLPFAIPSAVSALLLSGCSDITSPDQPISEKEQVTVFSHDIRHEISNSILASRFGGFKNGEISTRTIDDFELTPIVEEGDTLFYLAQYEDGWELYSADKRSNMIVLSSEHGIYDLNEWNTPEQLKFILSANKALIREVSGREDIELHESWGPYALKKEKFDNGNFTVLNSDMSRSPILQEDLPPGHWELIESNVLSKDTFTSPKLIETQWGEADPFNKYMPFVLNPKTQKYEHATVGCTPMAVGQYLYFTHYKNGVPEKTVTTATLNSDGKTYSFSGSSSEIWNFMAKYMMQSGTNETSILLGYVGKALGTVYNYSECVTNQTICLNYLTSVYNTTYALVDFDFSIVSASIDAGYPMIARAQEKPDSQYGHTFIIDQYKKETIKKKYVYALIRDPLPPGTVDRWKNDVVDLDGNVIQYAYTNEVIETIVDNAMSMNWGNYGQQNNIFYIPGQNWQSDGVEYYYGKKLYKPASI